MPRNGSGTYSLPQPAFVAGTVISSSAVNSDLSDIANALTGSLPRDGQAGMSGQMLAVDGGTTAPGYSFNTEKTTGLTHSTGIIGISITGVNVGQFDSSGWNGSIHSVIGVNGAVPIGTVVDYVGSSAPSKWLLCYGQLVSRTTYATLFAVLGTTFGAGDGTTFGLPDLRGRVSFGIDNMGGSAASRLTTSYFGSDPTVLGDGGGNQNYTALRSDLPNTNVPVSITDPGHSHTITLGTGAGGGSFAGGFASPFGSEGTTTVTTGITAAFNLNGNVSQTLIKTISPGMVVNKIIFAGA